MTFEHSRAGEKVKGRKIQGLKKTYTKNEKIELEQVELFIQFQVRSGIMSYKCFFPDGDKWGAASRL